MKEGAAEQEQEQAQEGVSHPQPCGVEERPSGARYDGCSLVDSRGGECDWTGDALR
jgi:hypothetical protein